MAQDENGGKLYALWYRGFHVILSEPLTNEEELELKKLLDTKKNTRNRAITHGKRDIVEPAPPYYQCYISEGFRTKGNRPC